MSTQTFTWQPHTNPEGKSTFRVLSAQFGDGYTQEVGDGINTETRSWPLEFVGYAEQIQPIRDFLRQHQGFKPFLWTPPMESAPSLFVTRGFSLQHMGGKAFTLKVTFEERFAPP